MEQVDFNYVDKRGRSIYFHHAFYGAGGSDEKLEVLKFLVKEGEKNGFDVNAILEKAAEGGSTCFLRYDDENIRKYLLDRGIKVNSITNHMIIPSFEFPDLAVQMMSKGKVHHKVFDIECFHLDEIQFYEAAIILQK